MNLKELGDKLDSARLDLVMVALHLVAHPVNGRRKPITDEDVMKFGVAMDKVQEVVKALKDAP